MDEPLNHLMQKYYQVVDETGASGDNIENNSGLVNGTLDGAVYEVVPSTVDLE